MHWAETHGLELLVIAWFYSMITSDNVMPALPMDQKNFWLTWLYNIIKVTGANLGNIVSKSPAGAELESFVGKQTKTADKTVTELSTQKETLLPKS